MAEKTKKNDFVEIEFTARLKDGEIFDTNIKEDAKKANLSMKSEDIKPLIVSVGNNMVIPGLDRELEGKEIGNNYKAEFSPQEAFGVRNPSLVKMVSLKQFTSQNIIPQKGMQMVLDGIIAKILSVSGGRVLVDFNNPIAGKIVVYDFKINREVSSQEEKMNSLQDFFFKKRFDFSIKEKNIIFKLSEKEKQFEQFIKLFEKSFEEILGLKVSSEFVKEKKTEADKEKPKEENSNNK